jgi:hypothetical protein
MNSYVFLMRHADRDGAPGFDDPINERGRARAYGIEWNCDLVLVSTLRRSAQTLDASRVRYRYRLQSDLCREHKDGMQWNYLPGEDIQIRESEEELLERVENFRHLLRGLAKGFSSILVITHGVFMCRCLRLGTGVDYCEYRKWDP